MASSYSSKWMLKYLLFWQLYYHIYLPVPEYDMTPENNCLRETQAEASYTTNDDKKPVCIIKSTVHLLKVSAITHVMISILCSRT